MTSKLRLTANRHSRQQAPNDGKSHLKNTGKHQKMRRVDFTTLFYTTPLLMLNTCFVTLHYRYSVLPTATEIPLFTLALPKDDYTL